MRIGVMALQGGFAPHLNALTRLGHEAIEIRTAGALEEAEGLVLPGGESTAQLGLLERSGLLVSLEAWLDRGGPVLATCAGLIVLASDLPVHREVLGDDAVYLSDLSVDGLVTTIRQLLGGELTDTLNLDRARRRIAAEFSWDTIAVQYLKLYQSCDHGTTPRKDAS